MRGKAEYLASKLTGPGYSCLHSFQPDAEKGERGIPSRLGFFHGTDDNISFVETRKLCERCVRDVVPEGYNVWSTFNQKSGGKQVEDAQSGQAGGRKWLDLPSSPDCYPPIFQAGKEGFTDGPAVSNSTGIGTTPVRVPMPQHPEAKSAWLWLKAEGKPFYIDQLHLTAKWRPTLEKYAEKDSMNAVKNGTLYVAPAMERKSDRGSVSKTAAKSLGTKRGDQRLLLVCLAYFVLDKIAF